MTAVAAAAEPPEEDLEHLTESLRALHAGRSAASPFRSPAARRLIRARQLTQGLRGARDAEREAGRQELEEALARIVGAAPATLPVKVPKRHHSLWDPTLEVDPYWSPAPILGFRAWGVTEQLEGARRAWPTPRYEAGCVSRGKERFDDTVPHTDGSCGRPPCGIYATKHPERLVDEFGGYHVAYGLVELSGKVVEHDHGYRARVAKAVFVVVEHDDRAIAVEGDEDLAELFADTTAFLERRLHDGTGLLPTRHAICRALREAKVRASDG